MESNISVLRNYADDVSTDVRRELCKASVTLDGVKAIVCGVCNDYATVKALPNGASYEWSWQAVERIVANGGAFNS